MSSLSLKSIAYYKFKTTSSIPYRNSAAQCIRTCPRCIKKNHTHAPDFEDMLALKSFDNMTHRKFMFLPRYQSFQYHIGQFDLLRIALDTKQAIPKVYILATTSSNDINYLNQVLRHMDMEICQLYELSRSKQDLNKLLESNKSIAIPLLLRSCVSDDFIFCKRDKNVIKAKALRDILNSYIDRSLRETSFDCLIVPVVITKDHERFTLFGVGSICIQLLEPFNLQDYLKSIEHSDQSTHLVQHLYYDLAQNAAVLPSHLVAFTLLYLERFEGVSLQDLVLYVDWFRNTSLETGIQIGFTGTSEKAVQAALIILKDFIYLNSNNLYIPKEIEKLSDYASIITPMVSYYGIIGTAILVEHNRSEKDVNLTSFSSNVSVKVEKDKVLAISYEFADTLEQKIPARLPCKNIETNIFNTINQMQTSYRFLKLKEPVLSTPKTRYWDGDSDGDDYYRSNPDDPRFRSWIVLTERGNRLDRLNLFVNAISMYL